MFIFKLRCFFTRFSIDVGELRRLHSGQRFIRILHGTRQDLLVLAQRHLQTTDKVPQAFFFPCLFIDLENGVVLDGRTTKVAGGSETQ
jgi:hypothetical protein